MDRQKDKRTDGRTDPISWDPSERGRGSNKDTRTYQISDIFTDYS